MSKILSYLEDEASASTMPVSFRLSPELNNLVNEAYAYRKKNGLSSDKSDFFRQCIKVALLCAETDKFVPRFRLPDMEAISERLIQEKFNPVEKTTGNEEKEAEEKPKNELFESQVLENNS